MLYPEIISKIRDNKVQNMEENERPQVFFILKVQNIVIIRYHQISYPVFIMQ